MFGKKKDKKPKPWEETQDIILPDDYTDEAQAEAAPGAEPLPAPGDAGYELQPLPEGASSELAKPRKKRNPKAIIALVLVLLVGGLLLANYLMNALKGPDPVYAEFQPVERGDIQQTLATNGVLTTAEEVTIYSPVGAPLITVNAEVGSPVKAGDPLFTYDLTELERASRSAGAAHSVTGLQNQDAVNKSNESQQKVDEAQNSITTMQQQRDIAKERVAELEKKYEKKSKELTPKIAKAKANLDATQAEYNVTGDPALLNLIKKYEEELAALEAQLQAVSGELAAAKEDVEYHNGVISQLETARDTAEAGVMDSTQKATLGQQGVTTQVTKESAAEQLEKARQGVTAPISGVVTQLPVEVGALAAQYGPLCTIQSLDKVDVVLSLSRYDLEQVQEGQAATITSLGHTYTGVVTKVDNMATETQTTNGTSFLVKAKVSVQNPDTNIRLGIDANVDIATGKVEDVVMVPLNAVNTDVEGTYCFVRDPEGKARRRPVETGLSNETSVEVVSGLSAGETVILSSQNLMEGDEVSDDPQYRTAVDTMSMFG